MSPSALPIVAQHEQLNFPVRLADVDGIRRLMQLRELSFDFCAGGARYHTRGQAHGDALDLEIFAELGAIPFSIQSREARAQAIALLGSPPPGASLRINHRNTVAIEGQVKIAGDVSPVALVAALAEWVLQVQPWVSAIVPPLAAAQVQPRG